MAKEKATNGEVDLNKSTQTITPEMMDAIKSILAQEKANDKNRDNSFSVLTDVRDPKKIEQVRIKRLDGKFVVGFKDYNTDPFRKTPRYTINKMHLERKLPNEPFITLILSTDGETFEEKELPHVDYMNYREDFPVDVIEVKKHQIIENKGLITQNPSMAYEVDNKGQMINSGMIRQEVVREEISFIIQLPGFANPIEIKSDFLA